MADVKLIYRELISLETELWNGVDAHLRAECGLQLPWFEVMQLVGRHPGSRVQDIADAFSITVGGASKVVDRVEAAGYCRRRPNPADRRSSIIELTPDGERKLAEAMPVFERELDVRIGSAVPRAALRQLHETLVGLRAAGHAATADGRASHSR